MTPNGRITNIQSLILFKSHKAQQGREKIEVTDTAVVLVSGVGQ
jgi:hypothetical protein